MNPLDQIERIATDYYPDLYLIFGSGNEFHKLLNQEMEVTYPVLFVEKAINITLDASTKHRFRASAPFEMYFLSDSEQLDIPVSDQREIVEPLSAKAMSFLHSFITDDYVSRQSQKPTNVGVQHIYYDNRFLLFGAQLRFTLNFNPEYTIC